MSRPQCIVTSYQRPKYLEPCLDSMRQDDIELYVVDGGSDQQTRSIIERLADGWIFLEGNPGADVLKNAGIERFVTQSQFIIGSDDYLFPKGWSGLATEQYRALNANGLKYAMMACPTEQVIARHTQPEGLNGGAGIHYFRESRTGIEIMTTSCAMVAGTVMDADVVRRVGGFPVYGKSGQGDWAISKRIRRLGYEVGYLSEPVIVHLGQQKFEDYPEYSADFAADEAVWLKRARQDQWRPARPNQDGEAARC